MSWTDDRIKRLTTQVPPSDYALTYMDNAPIPAEIEDLFQTVQAYYTKMLADFGLGYKVSWGDELHRSGFQEEYDIDQNPGKGWISGTDLLDRWEIHAKELTSMSSSVPIYLWRKEMASMEQINEKIPHQRDITEFQSDPRSWIDVHRKVAPNIWFSVPQWWWCKVEDIEFYEKLECEKVTRTGKSSDTIKNTATLEVSFNWLSVAEIRERWSVTNYKVEELVRDKGFPSYNLSRDQGIYVIGPDSSIVGLWGFYTFEDRLFNLKEVQAFENAEAKKKPHRRFMSSLNEHRRDRLLARDFARPWIREDPNIRSGAVVENLRRTGKFSHIQRNETLRRYIADLILNHTSGSPKGPRGTYHRYTK